MVWFRLLVSLLSAWLVGHAVIGLPGVLGRIVGNRVVVYLGRISYGLYVYHNILGHAVGHILGATTPLWVLFSVNLAATIITSVLSWHLVEFPINRLKRYFPY